FEVHKNDEAEVAAKVDVLYELERKIIEILLLYGSRTEEFEDLIMKTNEDGEVVTVSEKKEYKVYQRIFLSLQEDEVELANPLFRDIYNDMINYFHQNESFAIEQYLMQLQPEFAQQVTDILMQEEREILHNWEAQNIIVKEKEHSVGQYVSETILTLRWFLVNMIIEELKGSISHEPDSDNSEPLSMAMDYYKLINTFSSKLGRVMSRYS
ncbi:MAG TPA: DNA primase, partial [Flavobacterium sp.]|nr:DNA primase [Flavobacterium sp.]